jgi:hypothetical protein
MEKTFTLNEKEQGQLAQVDQERTQALAMVGALSLDMETARKNLDAAAERQRGFIRQALASRNVERYENARAQNGALIVSVPDEVPAPSGLSGDISRMVERVNGGIAEVKE